MKILLGGIVALIIGVVGLAIWWTEFLLILQGSIPILLALGGALAIYLGIEDIKTASAVEKSEKEEPKKESAQ
ncbi:MAG: hypothetical protein HY882_02865 [Deltaproteobacteria bacterium]|nr:hypothetical protein [Deltaproteobacteria bacterium]